MPSTLISEFLTRSPAPGALEVALNAVLKHDPESLERLRPLAGKVISLTVTEIELPLYIILHGDRVQLNPQYQGQAHCSIEASAGSLMQLGLQKAQGGTGHVGAGRMKFDGEVDVGQRFQEVLEKADIDWESHVASVFGDAAGQQVAKGLTGLLNFGQQALLSLGQNTSEYLRFETGDVPQKEEVDGFLNDVSKLRDSVARAEAKLKLTERRVALRQSKS